MCPFVTLSFWSLVFLMCEDFSAQNYQCDLAVHHVEARVLRRVIRALFEEASMAPSVDVGEVALVFL